MSRKYHYETKEVCISKVDGNWAVFHATVVIGSFIALLLMAVTGERVTMFNVVTQTIIFIANALLCVYRLTRAYEIKKIRVYEDEMTEDEKVKQMLLGGNNE